MTNRKIEFLAKSMMGRETNYNDPNTIVLKCAELAYKDMLTAGKYYLYKKKSNKLSQQEVIEERHRIMTYRCRSLITLLEQNNYGFSRHLIDNALPFFGTEEVIGTNNKYVTRYGLAQKFVNMTFKYLYVFSDYTEKQINFSGCDCPLDSVILEKLPPIKNTWSKINPCEYEICQDNIKKELRKVQLEEELQKLGNLAFDFLRW
jgi:hypothetical protein